MTTNKTAPFCQNQNYQTVTKAHTQKPYQMSVIPIWPGLLKLTEWEPSLLKFWPVLILTMILTACLSDDKITGPTSGDDDPSSVIDPSSSSGSGECSADIMCMAIRCSSTECYYGIISQSNCTPPPPEKFTSSCSDLPSSSSGKLYTLCVDNYGRCQSDITDLDVECRSGLQGIVTSKTCEELQDGCFDIYVAGFPNDPVPVPCESLSSSSSIENCLPYENPTSPHSCNYKERTYLPYIDVNSGMKTCIGGFNPNNDELPPDYVCRLKRATYNDCSTCGKAGEDFFPFMTEDECNWFVEYENSFTKGPYAIQTTFNSQQEVLDTYCRPPIEYFGSL